VRPFVSQWSLESCNGARKSQRRPATLAETLYLRRRRAEEVCRTLIAFVTPDGKPVLHRPLTPAERRRLSARAADLDALVAPCRRALARINAVLDAPASGDGGMRPSAGLSAESVFSKPTPAPGAPASTREA
jgi:hypothetical protein